MKIELRKASTVDKFDFVRNIRKWDMIEIQRGYGIYTRAQLFKYLKEIDCTVAVVKHYGHDEKILAIGGINDEYLFNVDNRKCYVGWMMFTQAKETHSYAFLKLAKSTVKEALKKYKRLTNTVLMANKMHMKFLDFIGAEWIDDIEVEKLGFKRFIIESEN